MQHRQYGFTLLELMVVVALIGILVSIVVPTYTAHLVRTRRSYAAVALTDLAARLERAYVHHNTYVGNTVTSLGAEQTVAEGHYLLSIESANANAFTLHAIPQGHQAVDDAACGTLILDQTGQQTVSGTATDCWS